MFDDEPPSWDIEEPTPEEGVKPAEGTGEEGAPGEEGATGEVPPEEEGLKKPKYNHHWVRPLFLNYGYLYDYRKNYYDDVIDYMDRRQKGLFRDPPRAQEWAERAMRTYDAKNTNKSGKRSADMRLISQLRTTSRYYSYHTRAYYSLKYQKIL
ncbi:flightin isoform X2 [Cephus cinctus]|nr:flightin isoform X2 [Cephus cinctus]XP_015602511.1 flightin isoform X2 [Cephus cinctus]XP_015602512.1 flightin isoform X2 [Cephus cinctus]